MANNEKSSKNNENNAATNENVYPVFIPCQKEEKILVVCDVCGYANPQYTALCKKCSNYLKQ